MSPRYWILVGKTPIETDVCEWSQMLQRHENIICRTNVDGTRISTVFLGIDHGFNPKAWTGEYPETLFETMIFDGPVEDETHRYITYDQAIKGHADAVRRIKRWKAKK